MHRNHAIEPVVSMAAAYGAWNGLGYQWTIGEYDDSLTFDLTREADVDLVWIDLARYPALDAAALEAWLAERIAHLRDRSSLPILVAAFPLSPAERERLAQRAPRGVHVADLERVESTVGAAWLDLRAAAISGTRLGNRACIALARELACRWLPACVLPPIKAVAVDLDGTLYQGVLGEDGVAGVELTPGHRALQEELAALKAAGMLLALISRNELEDVEALFDARADFPLRLADFSVIAVSWDDKSRLLADAAAKLRIGQDAVVFIDDNPGELAAAAAATSVVTIHAQPDAAQTSVALAHVAGVFRWERSREDALRADDLRAAEERATIDRAQVSDDEYLHSLDVRLELFAGNREHLARAAELVRKTNQFNLSLRRLNEVEIERRLAAHPGNLVAVRLVDRLSDSGVVAIVVGEAQGDVLRIEELSISCRALGRRLEDTLITRALQLMIQDRPIRQVRFDVAAGPRNAPARDWLSRYLGAPLDPSGDAPAIPASDLRARPLSGAVTISVACDPVAA